MHTACVTLLLISPCTNTDTEGVWKNCPHWLHNLLFFLPLLPIRSKNPASTHSRFPTDSSYFRFPWSFYTICHFLGSSSLICLPDYTLHLPATPKGDVLSPLHFHFTQTNSLDFFSLPAMHSRRVLWLQKTILLEVLQAQVLEDKKPPQLTVLSNCNGAAMAKNNKSGNFHWKLNTTVRYKDTSHSYRNNSFCFYTCLKVDFISCHLLLWKIRGGLDNLWHGRSNCTCSIKPTIAEQDEAPF